MKYKTIIFILLTFIITAFVLYRVIGNVKQNNQDAVPQKQSAPSAGTLQTQTNSEGAVIVKVTPENISADKKTWQFQIALDTHSGSLDTDLAKNAELLDEKSNKLLPVSWNGSPLGGHHREGELIFPALQQKPKSVILLIKKVGGIAQRKFTWAIE